MATVTYKFLANGQLAATTGDLFTATAVTIIRRITLVNTDSVARAVNLFVLKSGGTARRITNKNISLPANESLTDTAPITLGIGDKLQGDAAAATVVDYTVFGLEIT